MSTADITMPIQVPGTRFLTLASVPLSAPRLQTPSPLGRPLSSALRLRGSAPAASAVCSRLGGVRQDGMRSRHFPGGYGIVQKQGSVKEELKRAYPVREFESRPLRHRLIGGEFKTSPCPKGHAVLPA